MTEDDFIRRLEEEHKDYEEEHSATLDDLDSKLLDIELQLREIIPLLDDIKAALRGSGSNIQTALLNKIYSTLGLIAFLFVGWTSYFVFKYLF